MKVDISYEAMKNIYRKLGTDGLHEQEALNNIAMEINDYTTYLPYNNNEKLNKNLKKVSTFSIKKMTNNLFDRCITYNLKSGYKEDFGFSFTIKKI